MDANRGGYTGVLYAVEHGQKMVKLKREQLTTNVLGRIFDIFPETIILISDDGFVATANSKGLLKTWTMFLFGPAREHPASHLLNPFRLHFPTRLLPLKEVEREKARAGRRHSGSLNTPPATYPP